ncbi:tRNA 2-thiocytidine biosynthesis TtcA family protein [Anaeromicropila herbilytica]|uniref:tRNA 2-thiocytidine(32) synthetase TtcA n=1 Tax=Anaeromicropila herbilytica TaxID=2785025 RepID=A0A7R7EL22_9FIRM|nr:tRNA 2-thiocytidine biosynthesis TtcA family protein [Anaeromicropila herbilytica]BCN30719.1 tRNA 2-thiocytidine(32) synthetase TtcA [Anaeromicropila herbilytica]
MKLQRLLSLTRKAIDDYQMIQDGDRIAVGISGGKDSLTLLIALTNLKRFYPNKFELEAISVNLGYNEFDLSEVSKLCKKLEVSYTVVDTDIAHIVFDERKEKNPCSLCAKLRKGAFNEKANSLNCNKVAYAHHKDDIMETLMMSLLFEGRLSSFEPVTYLDKTGLTVIRPLMFLEERDIRSFALENHLPVQKNPCPVDGYTKREYAKNLIKQLNKENPGARERIFHAITSSNLPGWGESEHVRTSKQ